MTEQIWSWVLGSIGVVGFILAGKKIWWAWYVNIGNQFIWAAYAIVTQQWGFIVMTVVYFVVFIRNAIAWTKEHRQRKRDEEKYGISKDVAESLARARQNLTKAEDDYLKHYQTPKGVGERILRVHKAKPTVRIRNDKYDGER